MHYIITQLLLLLLALHGGVAFQTNSINISCLPTSFHQSPIYANNNPKEEVVSNHKSDVEIIARKIMVKGDVNGGYVRTCILNEVIKINMT